MPFYASIRYIIIAWLRKLRRAISSYMNGMQHYYMLLSRLYVTNMLQEFSLPLCAKADQARSSSSTEVMADLKIFHRGTNSFINRLGGANQIQIKSARLAYSRSIYHSSPNSGNVSLRCVIQTWQMILKARYVVFDNIYKREYYSWQVCCLETKGYGTKPTEEYWKKRSFRSERTNFSYIRKMEY